MTAGGGFWFQINKSCKVFVDRNQNVLPLHCQIEKSDEAVFKGKNCEV